MTTECVPEVVAHRSIPAFTEPTAANRTLFDIAHATARDKADLTLVGPAAGYGADPMNEQLFSGLHAALELTHAHV